jgi:hypothetical protein
MRPCISASIEIDEAHLELRELHDEWWNDVETVYQWGSWWAHYLHDRRGLNTEAGDRLAQALREEEAVLDSMLDSWGFIPESAFEAAERRLEGLLA